MLFAHDQPGHVARLIDQLDDGEASFWLHLDARSDEAQWQEVLTRTGVVMVEPRIRVVWGTWSQVEAMLAMVRTCVTRGVPGYLVMMSGQSYLVKSAQHISSYLEAHRDLLHMDLWDLQERWPDNFRNRLDYFCIPLSDAKGDLGLLRRRQDMNPRELFGWSRRLVRKLGLAGAARTLRVIGSKRPDVTSRVMGGSTWWAMPWAVAVKMLAYHEEHPEFADFLRWSQYADESFFQTLLVNMDPHIRRRIAPTLTFVDWTEGDWDLPRVMTMDDVPMLLDQPSHVLFARKFLAPVSDTAAAALDAVLHRERNP